MIHYGFELGYNVAGLQGNRAVAVLAVKVAGRMEGVDLELNRPDEAF